MILVTGATGTVGQHVLCGLLERGVGVRALVRDPEPARLPRGVEVAVGDLSDPQSFTAHLRDVEAVFLIWPFLSAEGSDEVVHIIARRARRMVYLSAEAAGKRPESFWARLERAIERSANQWTFLRSTGFAANTLIGLTRSANRARCAGPTARRPGRQSTRAISPKSQSVPSPGTGMPARGTS